MVGVRRFGGRRWIDLFVSARIVTGTPDTSASIVMNRCVRWFRDHNVINHSSICNDIGAVDDNNEGIWVDSTRKVKNGRRWS